jgi:hypothetical protein
MPGDLLKDPLESPVQEPSNASEGALFAQFSVLNEFKTPSGMTLAYSDIGSCTLTDIKGFSMQGCTASDQSGDLSFSFDHGYKVCLTHLGTVIEIKPVADSSGCTSETAILLTPQGVLLRTGGGHETAKLPNGVFIDENRQITDKRGVHSPDSVTIDPDGTRQYVLKMENSETIYSIGDDGTATVSEKCFNKNVCLSEKTTKWTANYEMHSMTRQLDTEVKIRGEFTQLSTKGVFQAPNGSIAERTSDGTLIFRVAGKTRSLKQDVLKITNDVSGEEIEYQVANPKTEHGLLAHHSGKEPPMFHLRDGTTVSYVTISGDHDRTEISNCLYISMPNNQAGRDHFFVRTESNRFAYVSTSFDTALTGDFDFQFARRIFED